MQELIASYVLVHFYINTLSLLRLQGAGKVPPQSPSKSTTELIAM